MATLIPGGQVAQGRSLGSGLCWFISEQDGKLVVARHCEQADVCFSGTTNDLILIAGRKEDPDSLFFQRKLKIEGTPSWGWR